VLVGLNDGTVSVRKSLIEINSVITTLKDSKEWNEVITFSPDGNYVAVGSHDNNIYIYTTFDYKLHGVCKAHNSFIVCVDWSTDSKYLQSVCGAYELLVHDNTGKHIPNGASLLKDEVWATFSCKLGWPV